MTEPYGFYDQDMRSQLRDTYSSFYYALTNYIESLPQTWFFVNCHNPNYDGSRFAIKFHDGRNNLLYVVAIKNGATYNFTVTKHIVTNK